MAGENSTYSALETAVANNQEETIIKHLNTILSDTQNVELKNIPVIITLLTSKNNEILMLTAQGIAESAKTVEKREQLTDSTLVKQLLSSLNTSDVQCLTQICRALGNLCYENDKARELVTESSGLKKLLSVIESNINTNNSQVLNITCGFLLNYLMSNESAQKSALELNILNLIENIIIQKINTFTNNEDVFTHLLLILNLLTENMVDAWFSKELTLQLAKTLELSVNPEISELCLELLHSQGENDETKTLLAKAGLCELLFNLLEEHKALVQDDEGRALMKFACDLIVLILTGDESMTLLYDNGSGKVYKNMLNWLESDDIDLLITGVLAMGNFARNDSHCIKMVQSGLSETLLGILSKHNKPDGEIRLQHALLSALRNLVIPVENKVRVLNSGLVDIIYPLLGTEQQPVVFKLLGTLRMVIDGQDETALHLAQKVDLLEKLVEWCFTSDHPGVRAESPRLLAWLIKHCHSSKPYLNIVRTNDCVRCLVEMVPSPHSVMQNEALLALNLLTVYFLDDKQNVEYSEVLVKAELGKNVAFLLTKHGEKLEKEVMCNLLTFLELLVKQPAVSKQLKEAEVNAAFSKCLSYENLKTLTDRIKTIVNSIDCG